jgi:hypothetical protein
MTYTKVKCIGGGYLDHGEIITLENFPVPEGKPIETLNVAVPDTDMLDMYELYRIEDDVCILRFIGSLPAECKPTTAPQKR